MRKRISFKKTIILSVFALMLVAVHPGAGQTGQNSADITNLATVSNENTENAVEVTLDEKKVLEIIQQQAGVENLSLVMERKFDKISIEFGTNTLFALTDRKLSFTVSTSLGTFVFVPAGLDLGPLRDPGRDLEKMKIRITVGKAGDDQIAAVDRFIQDRGMSRLLGPVVFNTEAVIGTRIIELKNKLGHVYHKLVLSDPVNASRAIGTVFNETGNLEPVPTRFLIENGRNIAVLKTRGTGIFTLIENDRTFRDISKHWAREDIDVLASKLIVAGMNKDLYVPGNKVTRAQVAAMLARALGLGPGVSQVKFTDVRQDDWYYGAVATVVESGFMRGYPDGTFRPGASVSREEAAVITAQVLKLTGQEINMDSAEIDRILDRFRDQKQIGSWARQGIAAAVKSGIMKGRSTGVFAPRNKCNRAEMAVVLRRVLVNAGLISPSIIMTTPQDNLYTNQEAVNVGGKMKPGNKLSIRGTSVTTGDDGVFNTSLKLSLGTNTINLVDEDVYGNIEKVVRTVVYDNTPPILNVTAPSDKLIVHETQVIVKGYTESGSVVKINDISATVDSGGNFNEPVPLELGRNFLYITAADRAGNISSAKRIVYSAPNTISGLTINPEPVKLGSVINIRFMLEQDAYVTLEVCRENGTLVKTIQSKSFTTAGIRNANWDGKDSSGKLVPDGKYKFIALARDLTGEEVKIEKTVTAARVPQVQGGLNNLPVFSPSENEGITIPYSLQSDSKITVTIFKGRSTVKVLTEDLNIEAGNHSIIWDGKDTAGNFTGDGTYTCRINAVSAEVPDFKNKFEFSFIIEREPPCITEFTINPNPFRINGFGLNIRYNLSETSRVTIKVLDKAGKPVVYVLKDVSQDSGRKNELWTGTDSNGKSVPEGSYKLEISAVDNFQKVSEVVYQTITAGYQPDISNIEFKPEPFRVGISNNATISYNLSNEAIVTVEIKVQWVTVKTLLLDSREEAGYKTIRWDGSDNDGYLVGEGKYNLEIKAVSPTVDRFKSSFIGSIDIKEEFVF